MMDDDSDKKQDARLTTDNHNNKDDSISQKFKIITVHIMTTVVSVSI